MPGTCKLSQNNHRSPISPLLTRMAFSSLALWHCHCWPVKLGKCEVQVLLSHICWLFLHVDIGAKLIVDIHLWITSMNIHFMSPGNDGIVCKKFSCLREILMSVISNPDCIPASNSIHPLIDMWIVSYYLLSLKESKEQIREWHPLKTPKTWTDKTLSL